MNDTRQPEEETSTLRERCKEFYQGMQRDAIMRQGSPVDDLMAFVISENGRSSDSRLEQTFPLCLYFGTKEDREECIAVFQEIKPGFITKRMP